MKSVKLQAVRLSELAAVVDSLQPKELESLKDIRLASGVVKDLRASIQELADEVYNFNKKQVELVKPYQEKFATLPKDLSKEEKDEFTQKLDAEFKKELSEKLGDDQKKLDELGKAEISLELGDEKFDFLKATFEKHCISKYLSKEALIEVADALGL